MRRAIFLLTVLAAFAGATTLTGSLKNPDGTTANGTLTFSLAQQAALTSVGSCGGPAEILPTVIVKITVTSGALVSPPSIYGNDCLLPQGTFYNIQFIDTNGNVVFVDRWVISGTTIDIGTIASVVVSGTTTTLGGVGFLQTAPIGNQTVSQPGGTNTTVNRFIASTAFQFPQGVVCDPSGCNGMTSKTQNTMQQGFQTPNGSSSVLFIGASGELINHVYSGFDVACSGLGLPDGWQGIRTDTKFLQVCIGGVRYQTQLLP